MRQTLFSAVGGLSFVLVGSIFGLSGLVFNLGGLNFYLRGTSKIGVVEEQLDGLLDIPITELQILLCLGRRCVCDPAEGRDRFVVHRGGVSCGLVFYLGGLVCRLG